MNDSNDTVTSKEALFMLDTDMNQDMAFYREEVTGIAIKQINSDPKLYSKVKETGDPEGVAREAAAKNNDEFGLLFVTDFDIIDWPSVKRMV